MDPATSGDATVSRLRQQLEDCRTELASARAAQEQLAEELLIERRARVRGERKLQRLSTAIDEHLRNARKAPGVRRSRRRSPSRDIAELEASPFFNGPWYIRQHPEVVTSGLSPAEHYLQFGSAKGFRPSPSFDPALYRRQNPEVEASGEDPLLHRLRTRNGAGDG